MSHKNYSKYSENLKNSESEKVLEETATELINNTSNTVKNITNEYINNEPEPTVPKTAVGEVTGCEKLNVRKEPSTDSDVLCIINKSEEVKVDLESTESDFYKVLTVSGVEGYCMAKYLNLK